MKRIIFFAFLLLFAFSFLFLSVFAVQTKKDTVATYLLAGLDDAASNTDFLALATFHRETKRIAFLQIPRDTFLFDEGEMLKINGLYPRALRGQSKVEKQDALKALASKISELLGITIDGYAAISMTDLPQIIDALGGVDVDLPFSLTFGQGSDALTLESGTHHLNGNLALRFVRYRKGYAMGDLARMDVQKLFLAALVQKFSAPLTAEAYAALVARLYKSIITDKSLTSALAEVIYWRSAAKTENVYFATLAGSSHKGTNGAWYYVLNRKGTERLLSKFYLSKGVFDPKNLFFDPKDNKMAQIYSANDLSARIYTAKELKNLTVILKES